MASEKIDKSWSEIYRKYKIGSHDFKNSPFLITADQLKAANVEHPPYILCWQPTEKKRPKVFQEKGLFILPIKKGVYNIFHGNGYVTLPKKKPPLSKYSGKIPFPLDTVTVGNSEMQHLDFAHATGILQHFVGDQSLVLTIRGRKSTQEKFSFTVCGLRKNIITVEKAQIEVDGGYEGKKIIVLVEAKNSKTANTTIRQLYYPLRKWERHTKKKVLTLFFERRGKEYYFWQFVFGKTGGNGIGDYNSISIKKSARYKIPGSGM